MTIIFSSSPYSKENPTSPLNFVIDMNRSNLLKHYSLSSLDLSFEEAAARPSPNFRDRSLAIDPISDYS